MRVVSIVLVAAAALLACADDTSSVEPPDSSSDRRLPGIKADHDASAEAESLDCRSAIGHGVELPPSYEAIGDAVALPTAASSATALQTSERGGSGFRLFAKTGLLVRSGTRSRIVVSPAGRERVGVLWSNTGDGRIASVLEVGPCEGSGWLTYPGGFYVDRAACVSVDIQAGGEVRRVQVGVGAPCPGQEPPPAPSDK